MINHWSISIQRKSSCTHVYAGVCACARAHTHTPTPTHPHPHTHTHSFPGGSVVENLPANTRDGFTPWVGKIPWRREWQPTLIFLPGKSHGQRSLGVTESWTWLGTHVRIYTGNTLHFCLIWSYLSQPARSQDTACSHPLKLKAQPRHLC